jgi:hypothetical protein
MMAGIYISQTSVAKTVQSVDHVWRGLGWLKARALGLPGVPAWDPGARVSVPAP